MVVAFSSEKYGMQGVDLEAVARRVRAGDLSEVLKIYEEELKVSGLCARARSRHC